MSIQQVGCVCVYITSKNVLRVFPTFPILVLQLTEEKTNKHVIGLHILFLLFGMGLGRHCACHYIYHVLLSCLMSSIQVIYILSTVITRNTSHTHTQNKRSQFSAGPAHIKYIYYCVWLIFFLFCREHIVQLVRLRLVITFEAGVSVRQTLPSSNNWSMAQVNGPYSEPDGPYWCNDKHEMLLNKFVGGHADCCCFVCFE